MAMRSTVLGFMVGVLLACDEEKPGSNGSSAGAHSGGNAGRGATQSQAGADDSGGTTQQGEAGKTSGRGGSAGNAGSLAGSGGMGKLTGDCSGAYGNPTSEVLVGPNALPSNLSITGDQVELFFTANDEVMVRSRTSTNMLFPDAAAVLELAGVCSPPLYPNGMDVTADGLRLYIACGDDTFIGPLRLATRPDRQSAFVVASEPIGLIGASVSISSDELVAYAVTTPGAEGQTLVYQRASTQDAFGDASPVPGLGAFRFPEISADDLNLFGVVLFDNGRARLAVATRSAPGQPFSLPTTDGLPEPAAGFVQYTPTVAADCSAIYFLSFNQATPTASSTVDLILH